MTNEEANLKRIVIGEVLLSLQTLVYDKKQELEKLQEECPHTGVKWEPMARTGWAKFSCPHCGKYEKSD